MTVRELLTRKLNDYNESMRSASLACGLANNEIERIITVQRMDIKQRTRRALCRYFDIMPAVLDAAIDEGRREKRW
ncbi:MAG: hypothetical protein IKO07_06215 [Clostridia bacterium]|nr:hypothetical protein [Clostridia bacterium]